MTGSYSEQRQALLLGVMSARAPQLLSSARLLMQHTRISAEEIDAIREAISDELMESGIDELSGTVNQRGKSLDDLIDWIMSLMRAAR